MCSSPTGILVVVVEAEWREGTAAAAEAARAATAAGLVAAGGWVATVGGAPSRSSRCNRNLRLGSGHNSECCERRSKSRACCSCQRRPSWRSSLEEMVGAEVMAAEASEGALEALVVVAAVKAAASAAQAEISD